MRQLASFVNLFALTLLASGCFGPFAVTGQVVDQDGNPLSNVKMHTTAAVRTDNDFDAYGGESSTLLDDGEFRVRCSSCSAIHLFFSKDGYHGRSIDLAFFEFWGDHTVTLIKQGPPADLDQYMAKLDVGPDYADTVMVFPEHDPKTDDYAREATSVIEAERYVRLIPATSADGSFVIDEEQFMQSIRFAELDFSAANGVAQVYSPSIYSIDDVYREMVAAPRDGYTPKIRLQGKQEGQVYFFYCIIDGHYCKGTVTVPRLWREGELPRLQARIEAFVNRNPGDRSLDDPRGYMR